MRDGWSECSLGDIAEVLDRMRKPISGAEREKRIGGVPYYGATGQAGWIDKPIFDEELVLLGEDAIDFLNPDVHKAYLISGPSWVNNHAHVLRAKREKVLSFFLMEALNAVDYSQFVAFGTRSKLTQGSMMGISVRVPPLVEQKRIVDVVSSVDAYIDALQQQADTARTARNAVLHKLLSAGGEDWTETTLGDIAKFVRGPFGGSLKKEIFVQSGFAVYEQQHAIYGDFVNFRYFVNKEKFDEMKRFSVSTGDLLMSCSGTVGKVSLVPPDAPAGIINQALLKISTSSQVSSAFLLYWTQSEIFHLLIQENSGGAVQQNVASVKLLKDIRITLPPIDEQKRIVEIVLSMDDVIQSTEQAVTDAKNLRSGLLSDLLSGEHEIPASYDSLLGAA